MEKQIRNEFGKSFTKPIIIGSYIFFGIGIMAAFSEQYMLGAVLVVAAAFAAFTSSGIVLDLSQNKYYKYVKYFGVIPAGKWRSLRSYHHISVMNHRETAGTSEDIDTSIKRYNVVLLNDTHRKKLIVKSFPTKEEAKQEAIKLSNIINFDLVQYHPQVSARTRRRRR